MAVRPVRRALASRSSRRSDNSLEFFLLAVQAKGCTRIEESVFKSIKSGTCSSWDMEGHGDRTALSPAAASVSLGPGRWKERERGSEVLFLFKTKMGLRDYLLSGATWPGVTSPAFRVTPVARVARPPWESAG